MVLSEEELVRTEAEVLSFLERSQAPSSPVDLIDQLKQRHVSEHLVRAAIWYLIDRNKVELTRDRLLKLAGTRPVLPMGVTAPYR